MNKEPKWLAIAKQLQLISQAGLAYSKDKYDIERFQQIQEVCAEIFAHHSNIDKTEIQTLFDNQAGYPTPKIDVRAAIFQKDKILLVQEKLDGKWALPGGWADSNLSLKENLIKEAQEEAGATITPKKIIAVHDRKKHNQPPIPFGVYKIFVLCDLISMAFKPNIETAAAGFFSMENMPALSTGRNTAAQLKMCFHAYNKRDNNTLFD
ncbi:MAG: NUDIX hydrolase N-terminal domain-containing protein [Fidelibacterota bacterium]